MEQKPKIVFAFVEAGMGHIAPATAISDAFETKYGQYCDVVRSRFFTEDQDEDLIKVQEGIIKDTNCGKNQELFNHFQSIKSSANKNITFIPMGFANNMLELNCAADLFVGKGGANAICEAFYFDSPAIVSSYANHLERGISNYYIKKQNLGEIIFNKKKFIDKIEEILNQKDWHDKYEVSLQKMKNDSGAEKVADILFDELVKQYPKLKLV